MALKSVDSELLNSILRPNVTSEAATAIEQQDYDRIDQQVAEQGRLPKDAQLIGVFKDEIENWTSWDQEAEYYICELPKPEIGFALIGLSWNDNWERWEWECHEVVREYGDRKLAERQLIGQFVSKNIEAAGDGSAWREFLTTLTGDKC